MSNERTMNMTKKQLKELSDYDLIKLKEALNELLSVMQSCGLDDNNQFWSIHGEFQKVYHELENRR